MACKMCNDTGVIASTDHKGAPCPSCSPRTGYIYTPPQKGCICPPGANKECKAWDCPRNAGLPISRRGVL
jgi:hypothetical protein